MVMLRWREWKKGKNRRRGCENNYMRHVWAVVLEQKLAIGKRCRVPREMAYDSSQNGTLPFVFLTFQSISSSSFFFSFYLFIFWLLSSLKHGKLNLLIVVCVRESREFWGVDLLRRISGVFLNFVYGLQLSTLIIFCPPRFWKYLFVFVSKETS